MRLTYNIKAVARAHGIRHALVHTVTVLKKASVYRIVGDEQPLLCRNILYNAVNAADVAVAFNDIVADL